MRALIQTISSDELQEIPILWSAAAARSKEKGLESYSFQETMFHSQQRLLSIILLPQYLNRIWIKVLRILADNVEKYYIFQDYQIFLNSKNLKIQTKSTSWSRL